VNLNDVRLERPKPLLLHPSMAANGSSANTTNIITALGNAFKDPSGASMSNDRLAAVLLQNMNQLNDLAKQGKLNQQQIMQVRHEYHGNLRLSIGVNFPLHQLRDYADKHKPTTKQVCDSSSELPFSPSTYSFTSRVQPAVS
jgi:hypothetical protein